jgi:glycosyltransferase involved in cell wall biosynthesis
MFHSRTRRPVALRRRPRVSVVIPLYNYGHFLGECIESVLTQGGVEADVLVIDDASTDDSLSIAQAVAAGDPRVRVVSNPHNVGMVRTINEGMWAVEGEYIVKMDADDVLTPGALARATALLDAYPSLGFVYGFPVTFAESPPPPARTKVRSWTVWSGRDWLRAVCRRGRNCIAQPEVVMRAAVLHAAGRYKPELPHGSDFEIWLRMAMLADVGRVNGAHQGYYRVHPESMQRGIENIYLKDLQVSAEVFTQLFEDARSELSDASDLARTARRAVAANALDHASRAYDEGREHLEPVDEYLKLAEQLWPETRNLRHRQALERRRALRSASFNERLAASARRQMRDVEYRLRWRRWRWTGV